MKERVFELYEIVAIEVSSEEVEVVVVIVTAAAVVVVTLGS